MKQWITLLTATAIFVSCSKENLKEDLLQEKEPPSVAIPSSTANYMTG